MDVILHIGAHRTASTSLQAYMRQMHVPLQNAGVGFWGPYRLRNGLFHGILPKQNLGGDRQAFLRAQGRIAVQLQRSSLSGLSTLLVSDENQLGTMRHNIAARALYPAAGERIARYVAAFQGQVKRISLHIRSLDTYWPSAIAFCLPRGLQVPSQRKLAALVAQPRNWRDVITDISAAAPGAQIIVVPFERFAPRPALVLRSITQLDLAFGAPPPWRNQRPRLAQLLQLPLSMQETTRLKHHAPEGQWMPFTAAQRAELGQRYADDLFWLNAGADGLATILEDQAYEETGLTSQTHATAKGHRHDTRQRLARPR